MASLIKGINITLHNRIQSGVDDFNRPTYTDSPVLVKNILVSPVSSEDIVNGEINLSEKRAVYELSIPKKDTHVWEDRVVEFYGQKWHTIGIPLELIDSNVPLDWNRKIKVERYG